MTFLLALCAYGATAVALALITVKAREIYKLISGGQPNPARFEDTGKRLGRAIQEILGHTKMNRFTASGVAHWFVMVGFVTLFGTLIQAFGEVIKPGWVLPVIGNWVIYKLWDGSGP